MDVMTGRIVSAALIIILAAVPAAAQVRQTQTGNALDANTRVGSGGANTSPRRVDSRLSSQLYVDGQVTGLARFRGGVGYVPANELRLDLPSAGLRDFRRRSAGPDGPAGRPTYRTSRYLDPSATVLGVRSIVTGRTQIGTNMPPPRSRHTQRLYDDLLAEAIRDFEPLLTPETRARLMKPAPPDADAQTATEPEDAAPPVPFLLPSTRVLTRDEPVLPDSFGKADSDDLSRELVELQLADEPIKPIDTRAKHVDLDTDGEQTGARSARAKKVPPDKTRGKDLPARDQDVFLDVLVLLREQKDKPGLESGPADTPPSAAPRTAKPTTEGKTVDAEDGTPGKADADRPLVEVVAGHITLHSLAGDSRELSNKYKTKGLDRLKRGSFYAAAERFSYAAVLDPDDPTAHVGMILGSFGAGEMLTAGVRLQHALQRFPRLMQLRFDVAGWMPATAIERGLINVRDRIIDGKGKARPTMAALAAWLYLNLGNTKAAKRYAHTLADTAGDDKIHRALAEYILTGKLPTSTGGKSSSTQPSR